jgi:hypothetical protein
MNNIKKFDAYFSINEGYEMPFKLKVDGNTLLVQADDKLAKINMGAPSTHWTKARVTSTKADIDADVYVIEYAELREALRESGIEITVTNDKGVVVHKGIGSERLFLIISTPKGEGGEIKFLSTSVARAGVSKVVGKFDKTWGFYSMHDKEGLDSSAVKYPYKNAVFSKPKPKPVAVNVSVESPFEMDSANLSLDGQAEIKEGLSKVKNKNVKIQIKTGASNDKKEGEDEATAKARLERDYKLVTRRYEAVSKFIKSLGFRTVIPVSVPKSVQDTKRIYGKFDKANEKSPKNRQLAIKTQYLKKK